MNREFRGVARGYKGLQDVTGAYSGLQRATRGYWEYNGATLLLLGIISGLSGVV